ncbi:MAG: diacylglycerol kinase [Candidatus Cyclobacteriaceae bacterium M2_1C_046]
MMKTIKRLINAFKYSSAGLVSCYKSEPAFRLEVLILIIAIPLSVFIAESYFDYVLLIGSILFVMIVELLNSAIEKVNDRIGLEYNDLCKQAKDQSSAAVLMAIIIALATWVSLILKNVLSL